jgi:hypothetical protein
VLEWIDNAKVGVIVSAFTCLPADLLERVDACRVAIKAQRAQPAAVWAVADAIRSVLNGNGLSVSPAVTASKLW